jgi:hypothetical protein
VFPAIDWQTSGTYRLISLRGYGGLVLDDSGLTAGPAGPVDLFVTGSGPGHLGFLMCPCLDPAD